MLVSITAIRVFQSVRAEKFPGSIEAIAYQRVGPLCAWLGFAWLAADQQILGVLMLFCSGGILYLIFDDIAPRAHLKHHDFPALGAVSGFLLSLVGTMLIH